MPTLIVLRHAKAANPIGTPDIDRPLAGRGRKDAAKAGDALRATNLTPDLVICSPALRTRQTLEGLGLDAPVEFEFRVYENDAEEILAFLREQSAETLLLVGHNPSMHQLVFGLTGGAEAGFPTSATAVIGFDGEWTDLWPSIGRLVSLWTPRGD